MDSLFNPQNSLSAWITQEQAFLLKRPFVFLKTCIRRSAIAVTAKTTAPETMMATMIHGAKGLLTCTLTLSLNTAVFHGTSTVASTLYTKSLANVPVSSTSV